MCLDTADTSTKEFLMATSTAPATVQPSQATSYLVEKAILAEELVAWLG